MSAAPLITLQDGKVVVTKLDKSNIFKDKNGFYNIEKLALSERQGKVPSSNTRIGSSTRVLPTCRSGSFSKAIRYYGVNMMWTVPSLCDYFVKTQGRRLFTVDTVLFSTGYFDINLGGLRPTTWSGRTIRHIWALQDAAPMEKKEPYTTTLRNHVQKVQFQLSAISYNGYEKNYMTSWPQLTYDLLKSDNFGGSLDDRNHWMDDELKKLVPPPSGADGSLGAAQKIFAYVRDQFTFTDQESIYRSQPIKKTWEEKKGNVAESQPLAHGDVQAYGFRGRPGDPKHPKSWLAHRKIPAAKRL